MGDAAHGNTQDPMDRRPGQQPLPGGMDAPPGPPAPRRSTGALWLGILSIVAGVAGLVVAFTPAPFEFRSLFVIIGIVLALVGVAAAIIALRKKVHKGVALTGLILSAFFAVVTTGFLALGIIAHYQVEAAFQRSQEEAQARQAQELAEKTAIYERSEWLAEARADAVESDFAAVDATQLEEILADPASYEDQGIIVNVTQFLPLIVDSMEAEGLCLIEVSISPPDGSELTFLTRAGIVDRATTDHCELLDGPFGEEADEGYFSYFIEDFNSQTRVWLQPNGTMPTEGGEDLPIFTLIRVVE